MKTVCSPRVLQKIITGIHRDNKTVGLVPTMGALHAGHVSLIRRARRENHTVAVTIFINPLQFGPLEDLESYPKSLRRDLAICRRSGVDVVFTPNGRTLLKLKELGQEKPSELAKVLCGSNRPGHFEGVVRIVALFFRLIRPSRSYFGQKDYQQFLIIQDMATRYFGNTIKVISCPTVREKGGLAMSSRNKYLESDKLLKARQIYLRIERGKKRLRTGTGPAKVIAEIKTGLECDGFGPIDYVKIVDSKKLKDVIKWPPSRGRTAVIAVAARLDAVRLIDNIIV